MNQSAADLLLTRAKARALASSDLEEVELDLITRQSDASEYTLLHIVGLAGHPARHEQLVAGYLDDVRDPMLTALALRILTNWWEQMPKYRDVVLHFLAGDPRDEDEDVLGQAVSVSGEYLRTHFDAVLARGLLSCSPQDETEAENRMVRMARALGEPWDALPTARQGVDLDGQWAADVLRRFRDRLDQASTAAS